MYELSSYSQWKRGSVVFLRGCSSCLKLRLSNQKPRAHSMILFVHMAAWGYNFCLPLLRGTYNRRPSGHLQTNLTWVKYCIDSFWIFERRLRPYKLNLERWFTNLSKEREILSPSLAFCSDSPYLSFSRILSSSMDVPYWYNYNCIYKPLLQSCSVYVVLAQARPNIIKCYYIIEKISINITNVGLAPIISHFIPYYDLVIALRSPLSQLFKTLRSICRGVVTWQKH